MADHLGYRKKLGTLGPSTNTIVQPEMEAMRRIEAAVADEWVAADRSGERYVPPEFMYKVLRSGKLRKHYQIDPKNSWMLAACEKNLPIIVPGWEDSTTGNIFASHVIDGNIKNVRYSLWEKVTN